MQNESESFLLTNRQNHPRHHQARRRRESSPATPLPTIRPHPFFQTRQKELTPNQPNNRVKQIATTILPEPARPWWYRRYSRKKARDPMPANAKKTNPVTSNHNCPRTRPRWLAVVCAALLATANVWLFLSCWPATRAAIPSLRAVEICAMTLVILSSFGGTMSRHLSLGTSLERRGEGHAHLTYDRGGRGIRGPATETIDEGTR